MSTLERARNWVITNVIDDDTLAVLLVGSWARGEGTDINDIDLIVIKQYQLFGIMDQEHKTDEFTLDVWIHDIDAIKAELEDPVSDLNGINNISMILSFLNDCVVWYEKEPVIEGLKNMTKEWTWSSDYLKFLEFNLTPPTTNYLKAAFDESIKLLDAAKERLNTGKPVSHRRKDYPELLNEGSEEKAKNLLEFTEIAYKSMGIERHWTEFSDGRKAVHTGEWKDAIASLKDVLRFMIRYDLPSVPEQLLDPSVWKSAEDFSLSPDLEKAIELAFT